MVGELNAKKRRKKTHKKSGKLGEFLYNPRVGKTFL